MRFSCKVSRWTWVAIKALVGTKPVNTCWERRWSCGPAQVWLPAEAETRAPSNDGLPPALSELDPQLTSHCHLEKVYRTKYIAWEHLNIAFRIRICVDLYMPHFFKKSQTWQQTVSYPFSGMGNLWMMDLKWSAQVQWQQGRANRPPAHQNNHYNSDAQTSARGAIGFLLFSFQLLRSFLTLAESQCCSH